MAAHGPSVPGPADPPDDLPDVDEISLVVSRRMDHVGVEVLARRSDLFDHHEVAVESPVVGALDHGPADGGGQRRPAAAGHVEALVPASAVARRIELADRAAGAVRAADRKEVPAEGDLPRLLAGTSVDA